MAPYRGINKLPAEPVVMITLKGCSAGTALSPKEHKRILLFWREKKIRGANLQMNDHEKENEYEEFLKIFEKSHSSGSDDTQEDTPAIHRKQPLQEPRMSTE